MEISDIGDASISLIQQSFAEKLIELVGYTSISTFTTPYRSGGSINSIPTSTMASFEQYML
jgi:hypothetical protein